MTSVASNLAAVQERLTVAAKQAGRDPATVRLIAVSKRHPASAMREAYHAGQRDFGESYVQELEEKAAALSDLGDLELHLVGHLQRNKAKRIAPLVHSVHAVDSPRLASALAGARGVQRSPLGVLVQVNIAREPQKYGVAPEELGALLDVIDALPALKLRGLMLMPPKVEHPDKARPFFAALRKLRDEHGGTARLPELSMGMSADLEAAVLEGSTQVRVGTAIFGPRPVGPTP